jgi:hypothetical protein
MELQISNDMDGPFEEEQVFSKLAIWPRGGAAADEEPLYILATPLYVPWLKVWLKLGRGRTALLLAWLVSRVVTGAKVLCGG